MKNASILHFAKGKVFWLLLLTNAFVFNMVLAQQKPANTKVQGTVIGDNKVPIAGATIKVKNKTSNAISDEAGKFSVAASLNDTLVVSFVNYNLQNIKVTKLNGLQIILFEINTTLDEIVVQGYGTAKRRDVITSVSKANIAEMNLAPVNSFDQMLAGRIAGVSVVSPDGQPGSASTITIRGTSVSQETSPLYVIDGLAIENMDINSINPRDIESFEVLKDPASVAIYGSRGANGVILITTKRGKPGPPRVTYSFNQNFQKNTRRIPLMDAYEFVKLQLELDSIQSTPTTPVTRFRQIYLDPTKGIDLDYYKNNPGFNWQDEVFRIGKAQTHTINVSGGNSDTRYSVSGNFFNQEGLIINTGLKRYDGRFSLDQKLGKNFRMGISGSYSNTASFGTLAATGNAGGVVQGVWQYRPTSGTKNADLLNDLIDSTALADFFDGVTASFGDNLVNPLAQAQNEYRKTSSNTGIVNAYVEYSFLKNFKLRVGGGYNATGLKQEQFYNSQTLQGVLFKNRFGSVSNINGINGSVATSLAQTFSSSNTLNYNTVINKNHKIDALLGFEYQYAKQAGTSFRAINVPQATEYLGILALNTGTPSLITLGGTHNQLYSAFSRLSYNYASKYYFMASMRMDGSSKFAAGRRQWGYFPAFATAWTLSEESFFSNIKPVISFAKLRLSYGSTGNNKVGDFSSLSQFGSIQNSSGYAWNNTAIGGIVPFFYGNDALTWETTTGTDLGLNLEFLKGRISVDAVYYDKTTKNFLLGVRLPFSAGYPNGANAQYQNTGRLSNSGFELTINTVNVQNKNFKWTSNFNISFNKSKILQFYNGLESIQTGWGLTGSATAWLTKVGGPVSQFYGYGWGGVYQYGDFNRLANGSYILKSGVPTYSANVQPGDPKYRDLNGDGVVDANDQTTLGSPIPIHTGGFSNTFTYKGWSLNVFMQWIYGNEILNANRIVFETNGGYSINNNQFASYANRWTPDNPTNDIPRARFNLRGDAGSANPRPNSRVIEDGSFLRLKTVSLSYSLPQSILRKLKFKSVQFNVSAQNILTWTKYSGMDPEVSTFRASNPANSPFGGTNVGSSGVGGAGYTFIQPSSGYSALAGGYDYTPYPRALIVNFGVNVTF